MANGSPVPNVSNATDTGFGSPMQGHVIGRRNAIMRLRISAEQVSARRSLGLVVSHSNVANSR
jgi:hypothetical protein